MSWFDASGPAAELAKLSLTELSARIQSREISCLQAVNGYLERIAAYDGVENQGENKLNAFITVAADEARAEAVRLDKLLADGTNLGPLHGVPIAIKDNLDTAGIVTTGGSKVLSDHVPSRDANVVARLKAAGAIVLGKTNLHEFAFGITTNNPHHGPARNPYDPTRISGGSSGGSGVAVAAGLCAGALGTDTGGSVRIPAAVCGCVGLKPTVGRVGRGGLMYLSSSLDCIGPMTRTAEDAAIILAAIAGPDERDPDASQQPLPDYTPKTSSWKGMRLGVPRSSFYQDNEPAVTKALEEALKKMTNAGATLVEVSIADVAAAVGPSFDIVLPETVHLMNVYLGQVNPPLTVAGILDKLGPDVASILRNQIESKCSATPEAVSSGVPGYTYLDALRTFRPAFQAKMAAALDGVDALVLPTTPLCAAPIGDDVETMLNGRMIETFGAFIRYTMFVNIAGLPAITTPAGSNEAGLPIGLQFVGKPWDEATLLRLAHAWSKI